MIKKFEVDGEDEGQRLDLYLVLKQNELSRTKVKNIINDGGVKIDGQIEFRPNYRVKSSSVIEVDYELDEDGVSKIKPFNYELDIVYEDDHLLAINKPAGMVAHPATGNWNYTLMNAVMYYYHDIVTVGDKPWRMGLIHRLDKATSGLILVGKTNTGLWHYTKQFAERKVEKTYLAVVRGDFGEFLAGRKFYRMISGITRSKQQRKKMKVTHSDDAKEANTMFSYIKKLSYKNETYSLVEAKPYTGRTHQIRVQLQALGYPILGDEKYSGTGNYPRLLLHASSLDILSVAGVKLHLEASIPGCFSELKNYNELETFSPPQKK